MVTPQGIKTCHMSSPLGQTQQLQACPELLDTKGPFQNKGMFSGGKSSRAALCWLIPENLLCTEFPQSSPWDVRAAAEPLSPAELREGIDLLINKWFNPFVYNEIV